MKAKREKFQNPRTRTARPKLLAALFAVGYPPQ